MTLTSTRILRWTPSIDNGSYAELHDEYCTDLTFRVTAYYRAIGSGDADQLAYATKALDREERGYWLAFGGMNPRHIIDVQDPAVIAAHADLIAGTVFNHQADAAARSFERITDLDNDTKHYRSARDPEGRERYADEEARMSEYRQAYPSGPTTSTELVELRRALSVRVITG